jgi:hypothetical protein
MSRISSDDFGRNLGPQRKKTRPKLDLVFVFYAIT